MDTPLRPADLDLVEYPHPVLRKQARPVTAFDDDLHRLVRGMYRVMDERRGVGLAAPQVAVSQRIFVTNHSRGDEEGGDDYRVWINPRIENPRGTTVYEEGCLSFPGLYAKVERHNAFDFVHQDLEGREHRTHLDHGAGDFLAIVCQHELDHLDGILFVDHLSAMQLSLVRRRLKDMEKAYRKAYGEAGAVLRR